MFQGYQPWAPYLPLSPSIPPGDGSCSPHLRLREAESPAQGPSWKAGTSQPAWPGPQGPGQSQGEPGSPGRRIALGLRGLGC